MFPFLEKGGAFRGVCLGIFPREALKGGCFFFFYPEKRGTSISEFSQDGRGRFEVMGNEHGCPLIQGSGGGGGVGIDLILHGSSCMGGGDYWGVA